MKFQQGVRRLRSLPQFGSRLRGVAVVALVLSGIGSPVTAPAFTSADADTIRDAYTNAFYLVSGTNGYFKETQTGGVTYFWQLANEIESVIDAYECTSNTAYQAMTTNLLNGFIKNNGANWTSWNIYNDDIMWAVMAFARGGQITGRTNYYTLARANFDACYARAWDTNLGGGLYWTTGKFSKNACVNGPGAIAAHLLYQIYGDTNYWNKATNLYYWERAVLYNAATGRIYDNINTNGNIDQVPITYNQGTFIGAADLLGQTNDALLAANYTMNSMGSAGYLPRYGIAQNNSIFNAIFIRWMSKFMKHRGIQAPYQIWLQNNANAAWNGRRASDNLSWCQWPQATPEGTNFYSYDCISSFEAMLAPATQTTNPTLVTLNASDGSGASSFESGLNWSDATAPSSAHDYLASGFTLRSPQDGLNHFFAGSSLTLSNGAALVCKNTSGGKGISVGTDLFLDNGEVADWANNSAEFSGKITLRAGGGRLDPQGNSFTISALIGGPGALRVKAADAGHLNGTLIISGYNTYTGGTTIDASHTVRLSGSGTLGNASGSLVFSNSVALGYGALDLNAVSLQVGNLSGTGGRIFNNNTNAVSTLSLGNGDASGGYFRGSLTDGTGLLKLEKVGAGTITLGGSTNVCDGGLTVSGGTLVVSNNAALAVGAGAGTVINLGSGNFSSGTLSGTLDVSAASNFTANVATIHVGVNAATAGTVSGSAGILKLGTNNSLTATTSIVIGDSAGAFNTTLQSATTAANGITTILTPSLTVGGRKANTAFTLGSNARLNLGTVSNRVALGVGNAAPLGPIATGTPFSATHDLSAGIFNGVLSRLTIGTINNNGAGGETGTMIMSGNAANQLDISGPGNAVLIGTNSTVNTATATGTLTISNLAATSVIASTDNSAAILLGANLRTTGTLNLHGGTLTLKTTGSAIAGGAGTSTLNLNGVTLRAGTNSAAFITNLTSANVLAGGVTFDTAGFNLTVAQALLNGGGGLTKTGAGKLTLSKANTYAGNTMIATGTLALVEPGSITHSALITISNGVILDVTGRADQSLTLASGKELRGSGSVSGKLSGLAGSTLNPGDAIGTLTVQSNITLAGTLLMELNRTNTQSSDQLVSTAGSFAAGGTLAVTNLGPALQAGDSFQLFTVPVSGFAAVLLPETGPGLAWTNRLGVDGTIALVTTVATNPMNLTAFFAAGNLLTLSWPADHTGWQLQTQTNNVATGLGTNWVDVIGSTTTNQTTLPVDTAQGSVFFRLKYP